MMVLMVAMQSLSPSLQTFQKFAVSAVVRLIYHYSNAQWKEVGLYMLPMMQSGSVH